MELREYFEHASKSLFRFEYLQDFNVESEQRALEAWRSTGNIDTKALQPWWDFLASKKAQGLTLERVRLVRLPLTDYSKFELEVFKETQKYGDTVKIITADKFHKLSIFLQDFWLIDDYVALELHYDTDGSFKDFTETEAIAPHLHAKNLLLKNSVPLEEFMRETNTSTPTDYI